MSTIEYHRRWRVANPDKVKAIRDRFKLAHREELRAQGRAWYHANSAKVAAAKRRRKYGVTQEQYDAMRVAQAYRCAICGILETECEAGQLDVDHDHRQGHVRGLLCNMCNKGIGALRDDPVLLTRAIAYLTMTQSLRRNQCRSPMAL